MCSSLRWLPAAQEGSADSWHLLAGSARAGDAPLLPAAVPWKDGAHSHCGFRMDKPVLRGCFGGFTMVIKASPHAEELSSKRVNLTIPMNPQNPFEQSGIPHQKEIRNKLFCRGTGMKRKEMN